MVLPRRDREKQVVRIAPRPEQQTQKRKRKSNRISSSPSLGEKDNVDESVAVVVVDAEDRAATRADDRGGRDARATSGVAASKKRANAAETTSGGGGGNKYTARDALHCVVNLGLTVPEALRVTNDACSRQYLYQQIKIIKKTHGESSIARRTLGVPELMNLGKRPRHEIVKQNERALSRLREQNAAREREAEAKRRAAAVRGRFPLPPIPPSNRNDASTTATTATTTTTTTNTALDPTTTATTSTTAPQPQSSSSSSSTTRPKRRRKSSTQKNAERLELKAKKDDVRKRRNAAVEEGVTLWSYAREVAEHQKRDKYYVVDRIKSDPDFVQPLTLREIVNLINDKYGKQDDDKPLVSRTSLQRFATGEAGEYRTRHRPGPREKIPRALLDVVRLHIKVQRLLRGRVCSGTDLKRVMVAAAAGTPHEGFSASYAWERLLNEFPEDVTPTFVVYHGGLTHTKWTTRETSVDDAELERLMREYETGKERLSRDGFRAEVFDDADAYAYVDAAEEYSASAVVANVETTTTATATATREEEDEDDELVEAVVVVGERGDDNDGARTLPLDVP